MIKIQIQAGRELLFGNLTKRCHRARSLRPWLRGQAEYPTKPIRRAHTGRRRVGNIAI